MKKAFKNKISIKLFIITALTFTTLLAAALSIQSYFYKQKYTIYKKSEFDIAYDKLVKELRRSNTNPDTVAKIFKKYLNQYGIYTTIFTNDKVTEKYNLSELDGYEHNNIFKEAIEYYKSGLSFLVLTNGNSYAFSGDFRSTIDGRSYNICVAECFGNGQVLLVIGLRSVTSPTELVDESYIYILIAGVLISLLLSYLFSRMITKPLVNINNAAARMTRLDFNEKVQYTSNDELGQLSDSLNTLSEKLNLTLNDLTAANDKLKTDIKNRKEFVANVSHELKTPLAIIKSYTEALQDNIREDKKERYINRIIKETDSMNKLVQDMLDLSDIEDGHYMLCIDRFDLAALTKNILESMKFLITDKQLNVNFELSDPEIYLYADRSKIGQVVINFIQNAIRHTPIGGNIFISVSEDNGICFYIENEGVNIDEEKLGKIWERFYRGEEHRNKKTGGTGLGLAISANILKLHQMVYGAENTARGVMFYFLN